MEYRLSLWLFGRTSPLLLWLLLTIVVLLVSASPPEETSPEESRKVKLKDSIDVSHLPVKLRKVVLPDQQVTQMPALTQLDSLNMQQFISLCYPKWCRIIDQVTNIRYFMKYTFSMMSTLTSEERQHVSLKFAPYNSILADLKTQYLELVRLYKGTTEFHDQLDSIYEKIELEATMVKAINPKMSPAQYGITLGLYSHKLVLIMHELDAEFFAFRSIQPDNSGNYGIFMHFLERLYTAAFGIQEIAFSRNLTPAQKSDQLHHSLDDMVGLKKQAKGLAKYYFHRR